MACRVWNAQDLAPLQTISNGSGWVTDCLYVQCPAYKKLVVAAQDRTVGSLPRSYGLAPTVQLWHAGGMLEYTCVVRSLTLIAYMVC